MRRDADWQRHPESRHIAPRDAEIPKLLRAGLRACEQALGAKSADVTQAKTHLPLRGQRRNRLLIWLLVWLLMAKQTYRTGFPFHPQNNCGTPEVESRS